MARIIGGLVALALIAGGAHLVASMVGSDDSDPGQAKLDVDQITCQQLAGNDQKLIDRFGGTLAGELASGLDHKPGYPGDDFVLESVKSDINTYCDRAINDEYTPADDIREDIRGAVETMDSL